MCVEYHLSLIKIRPISANDSCCHNYSQPPVSTCLLSECQWAPDGVNSAVQRAFKTCFLFISNSWLFNGHIAYKYCNDIVVKPEEFSLRKYKFCVPYSSWEYFITIQENTAHFFFLIEHVMLSNGPHYVYRLLHELTCIMRRGSAGRMMWWHVVTTVVV